MAVIDVGQIEIEPFKLDTVLELHLKENLNEHATFYLLAMLDKEEEIAPLDTVSETTPVKFKGDNEVIFNGVIKNIDITHVGEVYYLRVIAVSNTILIDIEKKSRSFQDAAQKYRDIIDEVTSDKGSSVTFGDSKAADKTVENIILQYSETDWAFSKRLASHSNAVLIPKINKDTPDFIFGVEDGAAKADLKKYNYSMSKNLSFYRTMQFADNGFSEKDAVSYTITTPDYIFNLGDKLSLDGTELFISSANLSLIDEILVCTYSLSTKNAISAPKFFNDIIGLSLPGKVLEAIDDTVKVHLAIDDDEPDPAYQFKYATPYSAEEHTGWYVMPEVDDTVQVIFPNEDEKYAYAAAAIRQNDTDKTSDPGIKFLRTPDGKEIKLDKEEILITAKDGETFIKINENSGIEIITPNPITVTSGSTIDMTSDGAFSITSKASLTMSAPSISMNAGGDDKSPPASTITMEASPGIAISTTKDPIKIDSSKTVDIISKHELTASAGKDLKADSGKKLVLSGKDAIEASGKSSSISMTADIELKAKEIKEN